MRTIICKRCKIEVGPAKPLQQYCRACSCATDKERKKVWSKKNNGDGRKGLGRTPAQIVQANARHARLSAVGEQRSELNKKDINWYPETNPDITRLIKFSLPYDKAFSKNVIWNLGAAQGGHVSVREEVKALRELIGWKTRQGAAKVGFVMGKVWLDIYVQKPNHKSDAVNVVDTICDGIKLGLGIDDRWYSIRRLDWEVVKSDPHIFIGIGQEEIAEQRVCSYCGLIFDRKVARHSRTCLTCTTESQSLIGRMATA